MAIHINIGINPVFGLDVRPHPGPLPQERGNPFPPLSKTNVWMAEYYADVNNNCQSMPIPAGKCHFLLCGQGF